jgi:predicted Zn-dependent protease
MTASRREAIHRRILKSNTNDNDGLYFRGRLNLANNEIKKAAEDLSIVTRNAPQFALGWFFLGQAQMRQNEINEAKKSIAKAAELAPNWIEPKIAMAQLNFTAGDNTLASGEIETILKDQPNNETALLIKGGIAMRNGESDRALSAFQQAQKVNPPNPAPHINIASVYVFKKKYPEALKVSKRLFAARPNVSTRLVLMMQVYLLPKEDPKSASKRLEAHLAKAKNQAGVYQLLGQLSIIPRTMPGHRVS